MTTDRSTRDEYEHHIGGSYRTPSGKGYFDVLDPATETTISRVASGSGTDIDTAVAAGREGSGRWQSLSPRDRGRALREVADSVRGAVDRLAAIHSRENGKPISQARDEVETCAEYFEYYAGITDKLHGDTIPVTDEYLDYTVREPLGVTGHIVPWNFPVGIFGRSVAPSLAAGNAVVVKPAEETPLATLEIATLATDSLPDGVLNVVAGDGETGAALAEHSDVNGLAFTGSVETGRGVAAAAGRNLIPVHVEAGGKNPNVVFPDADLELAVENTLTSIFTLNAGQVCSAGDRLLVHESIETEFLDRLVDRIADLTVGSGTDDPDLGPLVSEAQLDRVRNYLEIGRREVGDPLVGGDVPDGNGYFVEPTVFTDVPPEARIAREEIFGPVLVVSTFSSETEAIERANETEYGLVAGVFTSDVGRAQRFARDVEAGQIFINEWFATGIQSPFGGYGQSGFGREKGLEALENYLQTKAVSARIGDLES